MPKSERTRPALIVVVTLALLALPAVASARVLRVGSYKGIRGQYKSIQAAVNAAKVGDWILIGPVTTRSIPDGRRRATPTRRRAC